MLSEPRIASNRLYRELEFTVIGYFAYFFLKDCGRTRTLKGPKHGPSTIMRKILFRKIKKELKRNLKRNKKTVIDN